MAMSHESHTLFTRALAALLSYPSDDLLDGLPQLRAVLLSQMTLSRLRRDELHRLLDHIAATELLDLQAEYVEIFDRRRQHSLHLFEHVHGDSRERGQALIDLNQTYAQAGLYLDARELPDYLPVVLEFASTQPLPLARAFVAELSHLLLVIYQGLAAGASPYAAPLAAAIEFAGARVPVVSIKPALHQEPHQEPATDPDLDTDWAEPPAFDGCNGTHADTVNSSQPIRFVARQR
jgi:nitrate reductase molybdenum cofactor assembly chaperone NarJ/NarW